MKKGIILFLFFFSYNIAHATITISISSPTINQVTDSVVQIEASAQSTYSLTSLVAIVNGRIDTLQYEPEISEFNGYLSLSGLPKGDTLQIIVIATDFFNNKQSDSVTVIYVPPPKLNIIFPLYGNSVNANPSLPIKAVSTGSSSCTMNVSFTSGSQNFNGNFINSVDTVISFPTATNDFFATLTFTVTDKWGQLAQDSRTFFFENNPYLKQIYTATSQILDFNYNKVLITDYKVLAGGYDEWAKIVDINTKDSDIIKTTNSYYGFPTPYFNFLTPYGAVSGQFDWNNDSLYLTGGYTNVSTAGKYSTWAAISTDGSSDNTAVYLRDLSTRTDSMLLEADMGQDNAVGPNGIVFINSEGIIYRVQNHTNIALTSFDDGLSQNPLTDGNYVVYLQAGGVSSYIFMNDGKSNIQLSFFDDEQYPYFIPSPGTNYQINNKYVAYSNPDALGIYQIWLRDSTGANKQVTYFGTSSTIDKLNPNGDIIYSNGDMLYLAVNGGSVQPTALGNLATQGTVYYRDSSWYVVEGNCLYKILVNAYVTTSDGNWSDPSVWQNNMVPQAGADVIVKNNIIVNANETCNTLKVVSSGSVTVLTGFNLTVLH